MAKRKAKTSPIIISSSYPTTRPDFEQALIENDIDYIADLLIRLCPNLRKEAESPLTEKKAA